MQPLKKTHYTLEEYLELDYLSEEKIEYWDGNVFTLAGASANHNRILRNTLSSLTVKLRGKSCEVFPSDMRVKVPTYPPYRYPDLSALFGEAKFENLGRLELLVNPTLIIEILSDSTAEFDYGYKFTYYKSIESFIEYVLIAQDRPHLAQFIKQNETDWLMREFNGLEAKCYLSSLDCGLELAEVYEGIAFPEPAPNPFSLSEAAE